MKTLIRNNKRLSNLVWAIRGLWGETPQKASERYFKPRTRYLIDEYLADNGPKMLHIGAQANVLEGWLNVDLYTGAGDGVAYMDATRPFPLPDETFDCIFSEHMIEHIEFHEAHKMLKECYRVLKKAGKIRIATPDYNKILNINLSSLEGKEYFDTIIRPYYEKQGVFEIGYNNSYILNWVVYNFGHKHIYNKESICELLRSNGFQKFKEFSEGESDIAELRNIDAHSKTGHRFNHLETVTIQAIRR